MTADSLVLVDTNVWVYAVDRRDPLKQAQARDTTTCLALSQRSVVSQQVLSEYARVITERLPEPLSAADARGAVGSIILACPVHPVTADTVTEALRVAERFCIGYWDAQIIATALLHDVPVVLSEDLHDDCDYGGVRVVNPFADGFDASGFLASLGG